MCSCLIFIGTKRPKKSDSETNPWQSLRKKQWKIPQETSRLCFSFYRPLNFFKSVIIKNKKMPELKVNQDTCIGCGACESICPKFFKLENGKSTVIAQPEESDKSAVEE